MNRKFSQEQYSILIECLNKKNSTDWHNWREFNQDTQILLEGTDFAGKDLSGFDLSGANLRNANLRQAELYRTNLNRADLSGADCREATMVEADLTEINLNHANGMDVNLWRANVWCGSLNSTNLYNANLREANLWQADLIGANLQKADLSLAELFSANLSDARIDDANLCATSLVSATLTNASLTGVKTWAWNTANWNIKGVSCDYIYADYKGMNKLPALRFFDKGEFEKWYTEYPTITLYVKEKIASIDLVILEGILERINNENELKIRIKSIEYRGVYPGVKLIIEQGNNQESVRDRLLHEFREVRNNSGFKDTLWDQKSMYGRSLFLNSKFTFMPGNGSTITLTELK